MRKLLLSLVAFFMLGGAAIHAAPAKAAACEAMPKSKATATAFTKEQRQHNLESFKVAWTTVRDSHFDPKLGGVNWQGVYDELLPRVEKAGNMDEVRAVFREMLGRLGHSHLAILPASLYEDSPGASAKVHQEAVVGFDVRIVDGEPLVVRVSAGLPAAKAGVQPGWRIRKVDGEDVAPRLADIRKSVRSKETVLAQAAVVQNRLRGAEGTKVEVTFLDGAGKEVTLTFQRCQPAGFRVDLGFLPPEHVCFETRTMENGVVYCSLNSFSDPARVMKAFAETVQKNVNAKGFILDLRGNPGGLIAMAQGMGSWFVKQPNMKLGTMIERDGSKHLYLNARPATYDGPLAILVDEFSMSSSEFLAGGLQDLKRARVFGRSTIGVALPSNIVRLPNGDRLQFVTGDYLSTGGTRLEGNGVQPDEVVSLDRQTLLEGQDADLEAAMRWIRK